MSNTSAPHGAQDRRRRNNNNRRRSGNSSNRGSSSSFRPNRAPKQTPLQKFLSLITFGLLGKPTPARKSSEGRTPTSNTTVVTKRRDNDSEPRAERPKKQLSPVDPASITTERLYVGNLSYDAAESDLFELFNGVGSVRNAEVVVNNRTQRSKGFAFVTMSSIDEARRAVSELHGKDFMNRPLQLSGAKPNVNRDNSNGESHVGASDDSEDGAE